MIKKLLEMKHCEPSKSINYSRIPCSQIDMTDEGMQLFNEIIEYIESRQLSKIVRTKSGGISIQGCQNYRPRYDLRELRSMIELTIVMYEGCWRIQFRNSFERMNEHGISGMQAFWKFSDVCKKHGINIQDYRERDIEKAKQNKSEIEKYQKKVLSNVYLHKPIENVYHIDLNSSFMANLSRQYNEFKPVAEELYKNRKKQPIYKGVMTNTIGYFQSEFHNYAWAHLSKAAVNGNNEQVRNLIERLKESGRIPILINTDGIWYTGERYTDENEGNELGQWKTDHSNCKLLIKSPACYQYEEDGKIHTVMSGKTKLDKVKNREDWEWGDIYHKDVRVITYKLESNRVVLKEI